jgi:polyferredoxin/formate hydrogenlyase subunit 6/NADH:ubiquinone oxidoreductase subunit I
MKNLIFLRRFSQAFFFCLFVYILWSTTYPLKGAVPPEAFFKTNPLIMIFTSLSERILLPGIMLSALMLLVTVFLGRFFCGWICPLGAAIDFTGSLRKKKNNLSDATNTKLKSPKFFILGIIGVFAMFGVQVAWIFDPLVIAARFVSLNLIPTATIIMNEFFIFVIRKFGLYTSPVYDFYRSLKSSVLGVNPYYFENSPFIFIFFLAIVLAALFLSRFWCRALCPLGALYAVFARSSLLKRVTEKCSNCRRCKSFCRMGAIRDDLSTVGGECILCMDCVYDCPQNAVTFSFKASRNKTSGAVSKNTKTVTRKEFLFLLFSFVFSLGLKLKNAARGESLRAGVIRPPGALKEDKFKDRCIRCGNCMKVCITNGLQPVMLESGIGGIWTPRLVPEIGYCEYQCTLCGNVCPTGAIPRLPVDEKKKTKLGTAFVDRSLCIAWANNQDCLVCEEHCPVAEKAIKVDQITVGGRKIKRPVIDESLCVGCGICQSKCPVRPVRAVKVNPEDADRT